MDLISRYREMMKRLLPFGMAWTRDALSTLHQLLDGLSVEFGRIHERAEDLLAEMEPSGTVELLSEWESAWGLPNQCTGALSTLDERRAALLAKMIHVGQQTPGFFVRVAATLGYTIVIEENVDGSPAVWRIVSNIITAPVYARAGSARAGDPIRTWGAEMLECAMRALNPAHLDLLFAYIETAIDPALVSATIWPDGQTLALTFNQTLSQGAGYSDADFSIAGSLLGSGIAVTYVSGSGTGTYIYTVAGTVRVGETVTLTFTGGATSLVRSDGAYLEPITARAVFNGSEQPETEPETAPLIVSAEIDAIGSTLIVVFSEAMAQGAAFIDSDFTMNGVASGSDLSVLYIDGDGTDTWEFWILPFIYSGDVITLDYRGGVDGIIPVGGGLDYLHPVSSFNVANNADYSDIQLFASFSGVISESVCTAESTDYPPSHTATVGPGISLDSDDRLDFNNTQSSYVNTNFSLSRQAGRVGFRYRKTVSGTVMTLSNSNLGTQDYLQICKGSEDPYTLAIHFRYNGADIITEAHIPPFPIPEAISSYSYIELSWDFENFGVFVMVNGEVVRSYEITGGYTGSYDTLTLGSFASGDTATCTYDSLMLSSNPYRDLFAFMHLLTSPRQDEQ